MSRKYDSTERFLKPDPRYDSRLVSKFINSLMHSGKKNAARKLFYECMDIIAKKASGDDPIEVFNQAINNIKPVVEVRSKRVGGANYQVPREVKRTRQQALAIRWFVANAKKKKGKPMSQRLAEELVDAYNGTGASVHWKENIHKMAEANKAYAHYE